MATRRTLTRQSLPRSRYGRRSVDGVIHDGFEQGSQAWHDARSGRITASCFHMVMGSAKAQARYLRLLRGEIAPPEGLPSLVHGKDTEAAAVTDFEEMTGLKVQRVALVVHPELDYVSCSPDGLIGDDEGLEIKCPFSSDVHLATIKAGKMPTKHYAQVQGSMWITGRPQWRFRSFDPRQPEHLRRFDQIIPRDETYIAKLSERVVRFYKLYQTGADPEPDLSSITRSRTTRTASHAPRCLWAEAIKRLEGIMPTTSHAQAHIDAIKAVHPDASEIANSNDFLVWLMCQPVTAQLAAAEGTANDVISLLDRYKQETICAQK